MATRDVTAAAGTADGFAPGGSGRADPPSIEHLVRETGRGRSWAGPLIEAVGMWTAPCETLDGLDLTYLIGGEAFDWLVLAERLLRAVPEAVPASERERLLCTGALPPGVTATQFKDGLGVSKYRAHLNFFYGVVVEEALWLAVEREVLKQLGVRGRNDGVGVQDLVMRRLYGAETTPLLRRFNRERGHSRSVRFSLSDWKAFTYWAFKLRVVRSDSARTASDTRKALLVLHELRGDGALELGGAAPPQPAIS